MKLVFSGAAHEVTGSCHYLNVCGKNILLDCGMEQGRDIYENQDIPVLPSEVDYVFLSHAHIDHSGRIPKLYKEGYRNSVIATKATCDLCAIMLPDSGHIQEMEIEWKNRKRERKGEKPLPPLYTAEDAAKCLEIFRPVQYNEIVEISDNIQVRFNDAGHMLRFCNN